ncbi:MAG: hypothetical protein HQM16_00610 [Deltaproteobacteria bacterium]|nr:hypothetical protein [Deltaproteobacteria bacterium]
MNKDQNADLYFLATQNIKVKKQKKGIKKKSDNHLIGCIKTKSRTPWCRGECKPVNNIGECGRIAPYKLEGRTVQAIKEFNKSKAKGKLP